MLLKDKKKAQYKRKQRFIQRLRRDLDLDAQAAESPSLLTSIRVGVSTHMQQMTTFIAQLVVNIHLGLLSMLDSVGLMLISVIMAPIYCVAYCGSILGHSIIKVCNFPLNDLKSLSANYKRT